ncbi:MAG: porphobilinogen synthase [Pseudomonadota bacterium]|nr:porphobilinogen synthase [Pseudomonadota bacterium]
MAELSLRRTRLSTATRELTRQIRLSSGQFIQPLFVVQGISEREAIPSLKDTWRDTSLSLLKQIDKDMNEGIKKFLLFGVPAKKNETEFDHQFIVDRICDIKNEFGKDIWLAVDVCLCSNTTHGHCGILNETGDTILNGPSVSALSSAAELYASAGADCVAPSDMMDGRIAAIRDALNLSQNEKTLIMSYSAKFDSGFYGPFRIAADSTPDNEILLNGRSSYQIDPGRPNDALLSAMRDADEGADILMVKPGMPYLDILKTLSSKIPLPWAIYQTSGESAGIELTSKYNLGNRQRLYVETWTSMLRAGANMIISYAARSAPKWLNH